MKRFLAIALVTLLGSAAVAQEEPSDRSDEDKGSAESMSLRLARETLLAALAQKQLKRDLDGFLNRFSEQEEMIGERRRQELQVALFNLQREEFGLPLQDDPVALEETADIVKGCVFQILREEIENTMPFELALSRLERQRDRLMPDRGDHDDGLRLRVSPRFAVGGNSYVGAKLQLLGSGGPLSRWSLSLRQSVNENHNAVGVRYEEGPWDFQLQHSFDSRRGGHSVGLFARFRFSAQ